MKLHFNENTYSLHEGETVLDCLLRHDLTVPHSCKSGVCESCLMKATSGSIPQKAQASLKPNIKKQNLFLACQCIPTTDLTIQNLTDAGLNTKATIVSKSLFTPEIINLKIKPNTEFQAEPGQYLTLMTDASLARSYSIANNPMLDGYIDLHIRLLNKGHMSHWLQNEAHIGTEVNLFGPTGSCFYNLENQPEASIILAGTGTGLAPLYGIIKEALRKGHKGTIQLFHGARSAEGLYLVKELEALSQDHQNFIYTPCVLNGPPDKSYQSGDLQAILLESLPQNKSSIHLYLCGAPDMVNPLKTKAFMAGIPSKQIFADPFLQAK